MARARPSVPLVGTANGLLDAVAEAAWFDGARARAYRTILLGVTLLGAVAWIAAARNGIDRAGQPLGPDFLAFWSAARLGLAGRAADAWDLARLYAVERVSVAADPGASSFLYPPPFLLVCLPFGLLAYPIALAAWLAATGAAYLLAARAWMGSQRAWIASALAFPAVAVAAGNGQNGLLTAALLGGGLWLLDRRPSVAGMLLGALVVKPQLAFALPILTLASGRWRVILSAAASAALLSLASFAAFGAGAWHGFVAGGALGRAILDRGLVEPEKMASVYAAIRMLGGSVAAGYACQLVAAIIAAAVLVRVCRRPVVTGGAAATALVAGMLMSPFLFDYDLVAIGFALAWTWREGLRRGFRRWEKAILATAFLLPMIARTFALAAGVPIAPFVLIALLFVVARASDHRHAAVDVDRLPGDIAGFAAGEVGDRRAHVRALA